ncbi:Bromo adjacent-like proteiny [Sesbania bispinosa]|nr:Bromo adjacent-like proteiny [Sesbania bispinosa]
MERLACSVATTSCREGYVSWEELFISSDRGRRVIHYLLKRRGGGSDLALIAKEKSSRHMSYHYALRDASLGPFLKLKSRREAIDWLDSIVSGSSARVGKHGYEPEIGTFKDNQLQKSQPITREFTWLGSPWTCRKRRKHYQSFKRNGFQISVYDFVFVLAEENKRLVAYLDDMYEDSRGSKMVVVRWFHKSDEVGIALPHRFSDREVFFSLYLQDLSIECIDGLASVLSPQHYEKFQNEVRGTHLEPFVCNSQFDNDEVKPFDITQMKGYWKQKILRDMYTHFDSKSSGSSGQSDDGPELEENLLSTAGIRPKKRQRCTKVESKDVVGSTAMTAIKDLNEQASQYLVAGSQVEVLSQDSGIRGCWFRASIIKKHKDKVKVQYQDLQDAVDEAKKLEEWVSASRIAVPDDLGLRLDGRTKIRPAPQSNKCEKSWVGDVGYIVDAWWHDGWWEGIIVQKESEANYHVYFPGEKVVSIFGPDNLRLSQDWTGNGWVNVRERPDLVTSILSSLKTKQSSCKSNDSKSTVASAGDGIQSKQADTCLDSKSDTPRTPETVPDLLKDDSLSQLRWKSSRKRSRSTSNQKLQCSNTHRKKSPKVLGSDASDSFVITTTLKVDHDDCKYTGDPSIFSSSVVPSLTNMVMCR